MKRPIYGLTWPEGSIHGVAFTVVFAGPFFFTGGTMVAFFISENCSNLASCDRVYTIGAIGAICGEGLACAATYAMALIKTNANIMMLVGFVKCCRDIGCIGIKRYKDGIYCELVDGALMNPPKKERANRMNQQTHKKCPETP